jgi:hypothetical protein
MLKVFLDIETLPPDEEMRGQLTSEKIRKLLRKHIEPGDHQGCTEEEFRGLALHAEYGRVLTVGVIMEKDNQVIHRGVLGRERQTMLFHLDEVRTLRGFWKLLKDFNTRHDLIIGHNVFWDLKFLTKRSIIHGIKPLKLSFAKFRSQPIFDTMQEWAAWDFSGGISLAHLAEILKVGVTKTEGMDGGQVYDQFCAGCHDLIAEYCLQDVECVRAVFYKLTDPENYSPTRPPL